MNPANPSPTSPESPFEFEDHKPLHLKKQELKEEERMKIASLLTANERLQDEIEELKNDMEVLGEKLTIEIQKRQFLEDERERQGDEIENLTRSLFEEANSMVAKEARERHGAQERVSLLEKQLAESQMFGRMEHKECLALRARLSKLEEELDKFKLERGESNLRGANALSNPKIQFPKLDPYLLQHFKELVKEAPKLKASRLHQLLFMKNTLEDDIIPCLKFGGNPRTSTKKFIDAIIANNCFIEEMNEQQILELQERDKKQISKTEIVTPTMSLFNKTVLERLSNALVIKQDEDTGCATCGRLEPYKYRFKISDVEQDTWYPICILCRLRLLAVIDFYQFIRNIKQNLYPSTSIENLYLEAITLKRRMFYTRIGVDEEEFASVNPFATSFGSVDKIANVSIIPSPIGESAQ